MLDVLFIFTLIVFFAVAILFIYGCDWFIKDSNTTESRGERVETMGERAGQDGAVA